MSLSALLKQLQKKAKSLKADTSLIYNYWRMIYYTDKS